VGLNFIVCAVVSGAISTAPILELAFRRAGEWYTGRRGSSGGFEKLQIDARGSNPAAECLLLANGFAVSRRSPLKVHGSGGGSPIAATGAT